MEISKEYLDANYQKHAFRAYKRYLTENELESHSVLKEPFLHFFAHKSKIYLYKGKQQSLQGWFLPAPVQVATLKKTDKVNVRTVEINTKELVGPYEDLASIFNEKLCKLLYTYLVNYPSHLLNKKLLPFYQSISIPAKYLEPKYIETGILECTNLFKLPYLNNAFKYYLENGLPYFLYDSSKFFFIVDNTLYLDTVLFESLSKENRDYEPLTYELFISLFRASPIEEIKPQYSKGILYHDIFQTVYSFKKPNKEQAEAFYALLFDKTESKEIDPLRINLENDNISDLCNDHESIVLDKPLYIHNCVFHYDINSNLQSTYLAACLNRLFTDAKVLGAFLEICSCIYSPTYTSKIFIIAAKEDQLPILENIIQFISNNGALNLKMNMFAKQIPFTKLKRHRVNAGNCITLTHQSSKSDSLSFSKQLVNLFAGNIVKYKDVWDTQYQNTMPVIILTNRRHINVENYKDFKTALFDFTNIDLLPMKDIIGEFTELERVSITLSLALYTFPFSTDTSTDTCTSENDLSLQSTVQSFISTFCEIGDSRAFTPSESLNRHFNQYYEKLYKQNYSDTEQGISQLIRKLYVDTNILEKRKKRIPKGEDNPNDCKAALNGFTQIKINHRKLDAFISGAEDSEETYSLPALINEITLIYSDFLKILEE